MKGRSLKNAFPDGTLDESGALRVPRTENTLKKAYQYLFSIQNADGGWGSSKGEASTIQITAMSLISLRSCPDTPQKAIAINNAVGYLLSGQHKDGGFGDRSSTVRETALVYHALCGVLDEPRILDSTRNYIISAQSDDGSWGDDNYCTSLAIEACAASGIAMPAESVPDSQAAVDAMPEESAPAAQEKQLMSPTSPPERDAGIPANTEDGISRDQTRERLQNTKISLVSRRKASASSTPEQTSDNASAIKTVVVQSVNTDRKKYLPHETVYIYSTIDNRSDRGLSVVVNAQIADSQGHIIDVASHDTSPTIMLVAGTCEPATLVWNTGINPPGSYNVRFHVADAADGRILDERKITLTIAPSIMIDEVNLAITPLMINVDELAEIGLTISLQNRSNTDCLLKAELIMKDPEGSTVHRDSCDLELPASLSDISMDLASFDHVFDKCGQYIMETTIRSGSTVYSQAKSAIRVFPAIRIEATRSIDPSIVTPDGDKMAKIGIRVEGVGMTSNPAIVNAGTNTTGDCISLTFDKAMADPTGNESRFAVRADETAIPVRDVYLDVPDITTFRLYLDRPVREDQEIFITCTSKELICVEGKSLVPFYDQRVANRVSPPIFNQDGYGYSGMIPPRPLNENIVMTGYTQWPSGFRKGNLAFTGAVFDGQCIWMVPANSHSVVKIDRSTGEMTAHSQWPEGFTKGNLAFTGAVFDGKYIWMVPANSDSVVKLDKNTGKMTAYNKWPDGFSKGGHAFSGGVFDGENIWMIPSYAQSVIRISTDNGAMQKFDRWPAGFAKGGYAFAGGVFDGQYIWMIPANADSVIKLDSQTGEMTRYNEWPAGLGRVEYAFAGGVFDGQYIWMIPYYSEQVIRIDSTTGKMTGHHKRPEYLGKVEYAFAGAVFDGQYIWMVPLNADRVVRIDKDTGEATEYADWPQGFHKGVNAFAGGVFDGECIWMIPSYADRVLRICPYSSLSVSANITSNDAFFLYVSQDESEEGTLVGKGQGWSSIHSINASLVPGVTNYLHVKCVDKKGPIAAFIGDFTLNDPNFHFTDGSRHIITSEENWRVYLDRFGGALGSTVSIGKNGVGSWSTRFGIDLEANWIWTHRGTDKGTRYFSTPIYYSAVPTAPMEDVHITGMIGGPGVVLDEMSFTRKPSKIERNGDVTIAQWHLNQVRIGQREDVFFNVTIKDTIPGEDRIINDSLEITYKDAMGTPVHREFGPCHVHVLESSLISAIDIADKIYRTGEDIIISCAFNNLSANEKNLDLKAVIENAEGILISEAFIQNIPFPPGEETKIDDIALKLVATKAGMHRARVSLSDNGEEVATVSSEFIVEEAPVQVKDVMAASTEENSHNDLDREISTDTDETSSGLLPAPDMAGLEATIIAQPSPIYQGLSETIYYTIAKGNIDDLANFQVEVAISTLDTGERKQTFKAPVSHIKNGTFTGSFTFSTGKLEAGDYSVSLMVAPGLTAQPQKIAVTTFAVRRIEVVVT
jgi:hypothetical protein